MQNEHWWEASLGFNIAANNTWDKPSEWWLIGLLLPLTGPVFLPLNETIYSSLVLTFNLKIASLYSISLGNFWYKVFFSGESTEADTWERPWHTEGETEMDRGTAAGEPEQGGTDTRQTNGNTHAHTKCVSIIH